MLRPSGTSSAESWSAHRSSWWPRRSSRAAAAAALVAHAAFSISPWSGGTARLWGQMGQDGTHACRMICSQRAGSGASITAPTSTAAAVRPVDYGPRSACFDGCRPIQQAREKHHEQALDKLMRARAPEDPLAVVLRLLLAQRLVDTSVQRNC